MGCQNGFISFISTSYVVYFEKSSRKLCSFSASQCQPVKLTFFPGEKVSLLPFLSFTLRQLFV